MSDTAKRTERWIQIGILMVLAGILAGIYLQDPTFYPTVGSLIIGGNVDELVEFLKPYGLWAMVVSFFINVLINALGFLPSIFISTANGVLFGVIPGILISWLAECTGVIAGFYLMRSILRHSAEILIAKSPYLKKVDEFSSHNGFKVMLFARSLPYFPSGVITALGAVSSISSRDYILATLIGKFPSTALEVIIGHDVVHYEENLLRLTLVVLSVVLIYFGLWWYQRRRKLSAPSEKEAQAEKETE